LSELFEKKNDCQSDRTIKRRVLHKANWDDTRVCARVLQRLCPDSGFRVVRQPRRKNEIAN
jgi:hypothetical protein